jgi:hypothetical protein
MKEATTKLLNAISKIAERCKEDDLVCDKIPRSNEILHLSQSALNLAHTVEVLKNVELRDKDSRTLHSRN